MDILAVSIGEYKRRLPRETAAKQKSYNNVAGVVLLNAIVGQYEGYAEKSGLPLLDKEKEYIQSLHKTLQQGGSGGRGGGSSRKYTKVRQLIL